MRKAAQARIWRAMLCHLADGRWYALHDAAIRAGESLRDLRAALREFVRMGAPIQRDAYRGMRFLQPVSALNERRQRLPCALEEHFVLDSTNTRALQALGSGLQQRRLWLAEMQTAGRGRSGRAWHQRLGCGLSLSLALPAMQAMTLDALSLRIGVALAQAVRALGAAQVRLKWPNDVILEGKKLGGVLIEARRTGVVIGVGLNHLRGGAANARPIQSVIRQPVTSLQAALGRRLPGRARALAVLVRELLAALEATTPQWQARFAALDMLHGRSVRVLEHDGTHWFGVAQGIDEQGFLRVQGEAGLRCCQSAEVSVRMEGGA
ncbi:MAG: biotin--[acetyl-CoA-carboxylase] ligase [Pseudomonadota bacterium]